MQDISKELSDYSNTGSLVVKLRIKRIAPLLAMIDDVFEKHGHVDIIDIGGTEVYWNIIPDSLIEQKNIHITIVNISEDTDCRDTKYFTFIQGDGCDLGTFKDSSFHIVHSNSVIEHVGDWDNMVKFSNEVSRLAPRFFVQTPNYWFPIEPHCFTPFFHWLPLPFRVSLIMRFNLGHWSRKMVVDEAVRTVESARMIDKRMFQELFKDAEIVTERLYMLPKSFVAFRS